ncbi:PRC-barrel-containing protein-like protein [Neocallimastix californiae]|uniref:PRC-barrel-containing protein-like protein n=1 Tax=Neocallimastix californiae TaxID=1754190 RepID=A0A1Y2BI90_9FUNG|nr:PRC-barrel-containing protein-like protein [Neocallimastix californiae]|eukprot:ORY34509.1 PRC-barrel-containing protein-like protein [Neocallimastix californiae]
MSRKASNVRKNSEKKLNSSKSESSSIKEKKIVKKSSVDEKEIQNKKQFISINNKSNLLTENSTSIMVTEPVDVNSKSTEKEIDSEMVNEIPEETAAVTADFTPTPVPPSVKIGSNHHIKSNIHMRKFKLPNNKNLMKNALNTILGGKINEKVRKEAIQSLEHSDQNHFIILFQNNEQHIFRGLYSFNPENDQSVQRIYSVNGNKSNLLPEVINPSDVYEYYKYDTGSRSFQKVHTKSFQRTTHACALIPSYFKRGSKK